ncbi:hypothetical protein [Acetonema longum]|uniref:FecR protein domain-containing protein n=1 Tax=Acetonema longum DSM 6540 TaxID=1009370 RepID=F7NPU6_9FIRM|nr:hypothetical protein [Acetonema longum]EGO61937.1 hypothetical protein ALO_20717 [Acetonema longum DSM 6540]
MNKKWMIRSLICIIIGLSCFAGTAAEVRAESRTLTKDTKFQPQGWSVGNFIKFRKDTAVRLNEREEVVAGTLAEDTLLPFRGWDRAADETYYVDVYSDVGFYRFHRYPFANRNYTVTISGSSYLLYKGGAEVIFSEQGDVIAGTIAERAAIRLAAGKYGFVTLKSNTELVFYPSGAVLTGTLDEDTYLRPVGWEKLLSGDGTAGYVKFSKGKTVKFNEAGEVTAGTLKEAAALIVETGSRKTFSPGTKVEFSPAGAAAKSDKLEMTMP